MLIYDVLHKEKVYRSVANDLRDLGVKHRLKKNAMKNEKLERNRNCSRKVFKVPLSYQALDVVSLPSGAIVHVPAFVCQATAFLDNFLSHEGLFRKAGSQARQKELIGRLDAGGALGDKNHAIDVANSLKTFFRDLPEPLIPYAYHDLFVRCLVLPSRAVPAILLACILLPPLHLNTLAYFMSFLKKVAHHESLNKMGIENLATVIGPNVMPLQETTMSAVQSRLEAHLVIVKLLIENAEEIGVLPEHISEAIAAEVIGSVETELDQSDPVSRSRNKKKKHRSGSLTRMFNGLRKIVGKSGSPGEVGQQNNELAVPELDPLHTPAIKVGKKRKVAESVGSVSVKKKRDILDAMPKRSNYSRPMLASPVCSDPNPARERSPVHKSKVRKYLTQKVQSEMRVLEKIERPKKIRLSLERLYSRSKQKVTDAEMDQSCKELYSPCIERRWSSASSASAAKKNREEKSGGGKAASPLIRKATTLSNVRDDYDRVFMDADVNLSDDCNEQNQQQDRTIKSDNKTTDNNRAGNCRRSLDAILLAETAKGDRKMDNTGSKHDKNLRSTCRRSSTNEFAKNPANWSKESSDVDSRVISRVSATEEYVRIPKSEYEEIKSRVSAIESRISQEFGNMGNCDLEGINSASEVQSEYEKTLGEASIESTITADNLAKRLSKELKIRRSAEHKIIRSPSARKIGILRRRSQEKAPSRRVSRNASWHITHRAETSRDDEKPPDNCRNNFYPSPKITREAKTEVYYDKMGADSLCSDETNARLNYLQEQLHTLITHTAEHTRGTFSDEDNFPAEDDVFSVGNKAPPSVRRASSFHGKEFIDNSRYFNKRIQELKKTNSQQNVTNSEEETPRRVEKGKTISWKDAAGYFKSEIRSNAPTPVPQTGRASIAKLRTQNAGMVLAKAKLFDDNETRKVGGESATAEKRMHANREALSGKGAPRLRELRNRDGEMSPRKASSARRKSSRSPKNHNSSGRMRIASTSGNNYSPVIKMELTILPSQREPRQITDKRSGRRSQKIEQENRELTLASGKYEDEYSDGKKITNRPTYNELFSPKAILQSSKDNANNTEANFTCKTPHIKRSLATKTPRSAKSLARRPIVDTRRTPLKAVAPATPKRQSPRNVLKSRALSQPIN